MNAMGTVVSRGVPPYSVDCVEVDASAEALGHHHVTAIGTTDPDGGQTRWTLVDVIAAVRDGERFIVAGDGGQAAELGPTVCPRCHMSTLTIEGRDGLEPLRRCP